MGAVIKLNSSSLSRGNLKIFKENRVENFWINEARFSGENLVVAIRFPHVLRARDADIYFSYDEIAPFVKGILNRVIKSYKSYKNDKNAK